MPPPTAPGGRFVTPPTTSTSDSPVRPATNEVDVDGPLSQPTEPTREADDLPASDGDPISEPNNPTPHRRRIPALVAGVQSVAQQIFANTHLAGLIDNHPACSRFIYPSQIRMRSKVSS